MSQAKLTALFALLPEHIQMKAILDYLYELGDSAELIKAEGFFKSYCEIEGGEFIKAQGAWYLMGRAIRRHDLKRALKFYAFLEALGNSDDILTVRAKAVYIMVDALLVEHLSAAHRLWDKFASKSPPLEAKWMCARAGLLLLKQGYRNSDRRIAKAVFQALRNFSDAPECRKILGQAEAICRRQKGCA